FSSRRRHTRFSRDWSSDVCSSDLTAEAQVYGARGPEPGRVEGRIEGDTIHVTVFHAGREVAFQARLRRPAGQGPHPVMIVVGGGIGRASGRERVWGRGGAVA